MNEKEIFVTVFDSISDAIIEFRISADSHDQSMMASPFTLHQEAARSFACCLYGIDTF